MTVARTTVSLRIEETVVRIEMDGGAARTEVKLVFSNDTPRVVEGEFTPPLPPGATVLSYALEVDRALGDTVAVGKERACNAIFFRADPAADRTICEALAMVKSVPCRIFK